MKNNPFFPVQFGNVGRRLEAELEAAAHTVDKILRQTPIENWSALSGHPDLLTSGALSRMSIIFADALSTDPKHALRLAELEVSIAEAIPETSYPSTVHAQIRAHAWKDLGKVLSVVNRNPESIDALRHAESLLTDHRASDTTSQSSGST